MTDYAIGSAGLGPRDVQDRLEAAYAGLSRQLKVAARHILDAPEEVVLHSMRGLAARAGVQPSTMSRLARELGFGGYREFQEPFREALRSGPTRYAARARQLQIRRAGTASDDLFDTLSTTAARNIERTFEATTAGALESAAALLETAGRIYVVGMRKCFPLAHYMHYACRMFHPRVTLVTGNAGTYADELAPMAAGDVLLAIAFDRYTWETVTAARRARAVGAGIIAITDSRVSPLAEGADHVFIAANSSPSFFRSLSGAQAVVEALVAFLVARTGQEGVDTLTKMEQRLDEFGVYWRDGDRRRRAT